MNSAAFFAIFSFHTKNRGLHTYRFFLFGGWIFVLYLCGVNSIIINAKLIKLWKRTSRNVWLSVV